MSRIYLYLFNPFLAADDRVSFIQAAMPQELNHSFLILRPCGMARVPFLVNTWNPGIKMSQAQDVSTNARSSAKANQPDPKPSGPQR